MKQFFLEQWDVIAIIWFCLAFVFGGWHCVNEDQDRRRLNQQTCEPYRVVHAEEDRVYCQISSTSVEIRQVTK